MDKENIKDKNTQDHIISKMEDEELENVAGGNGNSLKSSRFNVGDKVILMIYPEYGIGTVISVYMKEGRWQCVVKFAAGVMDADEIEFVPS